MATRLIWSSKQTPPVPPRPYMCFAANHHSCYEYFRTETHGVRIDLCEDHLPRGVWDTVEIWVEFISETHQATYYQEPPAYSLPATGKSKL